VYETNISPALRSGSPAIFKRSISVALRRWRLDRGLSQKTAAEHAGRSVQHISNLESGRLPTAGDLELLLDLYGQTEKTRFMRELLSAAKKAKNWWTGMSGVVPTWFDLFLGLESGATELAIYETVLVNGLLQTPDYARAVLRGNPQHSDEEIDTCVELRMRRKEIFDRADPARLRMVLDESVLHRPHGGPAVLCKQLDHLLELSERPGIDIQILRYDASPTPAQEGGSFIMMKFPASITGDPGLVHVELLTGGQYVEKTEEVSKYGRAMTRLQAQAADQDTSRGIIRRVLREVS